MITHLEYGLQIMLDRWQSAFLSIRIRGEGRGKAYYARREGLGRDRTRYAREEKQTTDSSVFFFRGYLELSK